MKQKTEGENRTFRLDAETLQKLRDLAGRDGIRPNAVVTQLIRRAWEERAPRWHAATRNREQSS